MATGRREDRVMGFFNSHRTLGREHISQTPNSYSKHSEQHPSNIGRYNRDSYLKYNEQYPANIVKYHGGFQIGSEYFIIYELLDWMRPISLIPPSAYFTSPMGTIHQQNPFTNLAKLSIQLLSAIVSANEKFLIHGNINPDNILYLDSQITNKIKLIGFGSATTNKDLSEYFDNFQIQSWGYRAPEVVIGDYDTNEKIDVWSVGVILLELLVNHVFRSLKNEWRLIESDSRISAVVCITRAIEDLDIYRQRKTKFWNEELSFHAMTQSGEITDTGSTIKRLVRAFQTEQEYLALDFILCLIQVDHRLRWSAKRALCHPFIIKSLQPVWARTLMSASSEIIPSDSFVKSYLMG